MSTNKRTNILIIGTGAVGAFYGSRLHNPSKNTFVSVTCRSNYPQVKEHGLDMDTHSFGSYHFRPHQVFSSVQEAASHSSSDPWDYIVLATKALPDVTDDTLLVEPLLPRSPSSPSSESSPTLILIQNGLGVESPHRIKFPQTPILSAVTIVSAIQSSPGKIKQNRWTRITLGPYLGEEKGEEEGKGGELERISYERNKDFVRILKEGGIKDAEEVDEVELQAVRWHKLAINASMNPSSVLSGGTTNQEMSLDPDLRHHLHSCMNEILLNAPKILGRPWSDKLSKISAEKILKSTERNEGGVPSMLVDWREGRRMELEVILGNPIRIAKKKGIELPRLQTLYALLKMAQIHHLSPSNNSSTSEKKAKL